jgi:flagellar basal-body rod protein FlgB
MSLISIPGRTLCVLERALDLLSIRHQATANNIANVDTPGYQARRFDFESQLRRAIGPSDRAADASERDIAGVTGCVRADAGPARADGNNVHIEREVAALARTGAQYTVLAKLIAARLRALQDVVAERG